MVIHGADNTNPDETAIDPEAIAISVDNSLIEPLLSTPASNYPINGPGEEYLGER